MSTQQSGYVCENGNASGKREPLQDGEYEPTRQGPVCQRRPRDTGHLRSELVEGPFPARRKPSDADDLVKLVRIVDHHRLVVVVDDNL